MMVNLVKAFLIQRQLWMIERASHSANPGVVVLHPKRLCDLKSQLSSIMLQSASPFEEGKIETVFGFALRESIDVPLEVRGRSVAFLLEPKDDSARLIFFED
jgi:hypothetical protein